MKPHEAISEREARMRKEIRSFYKQFPVAFRELVDEYEAWAAETAPEGRQTPPAVYAALLAEWLHAKAAGMKRDRFIDEAAIKGWRWSDRRGRRHLLANSHTVRRTLEKAQKMARHDESFRKQVEGWLSSLRELRPHNRR